MAQTYTVIYRGTALQGVPIMKTIEGAMSVTEALRMFEAWATGSPEHEWRNWNVLYIFPSDTPNGAVSGYNVKVAPPQQRWVVDNGS